MLRHLAAGIASTFKQQGLEAGLAAELAQAAVEHLRRRHAGRILYIPHARYAAADDRQNEMIRDWRAGLTVEDIAKRYEVSNRWVYAVLAKRRREDAGRRRI